MRCALWGIMSVVFTPDGMKEGDDSLPTDAPAGICGKSSLSVPTKDTNADSTEPDDNLSQDAQVRHRSTSYVSIQRFELNWCAKLQYCIKHLRIKHRFHPTSQREQHPGKLALNIRNAPNWKFLAEAEQNETLGRIPNTAFCIFSPQIFCQFFFTIA